MWNAIEAVKNGEAVAAVSAGNTGALMAQAMFILRKVDGVERPALAASWPTRTGAMRYARPWRGHRRRRLNSWSSLRSWARLLPAS